MKIRKKKSLQSIGGSACFKKHGPEHYRKMAEMSLKTRYKNIALLKKVRAGK